MRSSFYGYVLALCLFFLLVAPSRKALPQDAKVSPPTPNQREKVTKKSLAGTPSAHQPDIKRKNRTNPTKSRRSLRPSSKGKALGQLTPEPYKAAVVMDAATGHVLFSRDPHKTLVPASLTKMMLVLIVMEKVRGGQLRLSEPVVATERTTSVGGTQVDLRPGEALPLEEMLLAILVRSANDAAATVAEHVAGSESRFVDMMNQKARRLGMKDTQFVNVHGLPGQNGHENISTAYDMALLAKALLRYPEVLRWSSQPVAFIRDGRYPLQSTNKLLGQCEGVDGLKTGFTRKAGFNIAATAFRNGKRIIVVVMGSPTSKLRNEATATLLTQAFGDSPQVGKPLAMPGSQKNTQKRSASPHVSNPNRRGG